MTRTVFLSSLAFQSRGFSGARPYLCALIALVISISPAWADGKAFPGAMFDPTSLTMPDQRAIVAFSDGVETLVIETSILGIDGRAAWIIPLPAVPEIKAGTAGLFPTTQRVFADPVKKW